MAGGLDTRTAMDGFARGMSLGNSTFDRIRENERYKQQHKEKVASGLKADARYEEALIREQGRFDVKEARAIKAEGRADDDYERKQALLETKSIYQSWSNGDKPEQVDIERMKVIQRMPGMKQYNIGINLNPETETHLKNAERTLSQVGDGNYSTVNGSEFLSSATYLLRDSFKGGKDGRTRKLAGLIPAKREDGTPDPEHVYLDFEVTDPETGETYNAPGTENGGTEADGDMALRKVPISQIATMLKGRRLMYDNFNKNPETLKKLRKVMLANGMIKPPGKQEYVIGAWGDGNAVLNKQTGKVVTTSNDRAGGAGGGRSTKAESKEFFALQGKIASARKTILAGGGMMDEAAFKEAIEPLETELENKFGVTPADIENYRADLSQQGKLDTLSLDGLKKYKRDLQALAYQRYMDKSEALAKKKQGEVQGRRKEVADYYDALPQRNGFTPSGPSDPSKRIARLERQLATGKASGRALSKSDRKMLSAELSSLKGESGGMYASGPGPADSRS